MDIIRVMKLMGFKWVEIYHSSERRNSYMFLQEILNGRDQFRDPGTEGKIALKWILREVGCDGLCWILFRVRDIPNTVINPRVPGKKTILFSTLNAS
jgi:hypothetical protein